MTLDALVSYLRDHAKGACALDIVRDILSLSVKDAAVAEKLVSAALGGDRRFERSPDGRWHFVPADEPASRLAEATFGAVECTIATTSAGPELIELAAVRFSVEGLGEILHRWARPGQSPAPEELALLGVDADALAQAASPGDVWTEYETFIAGLPQVTYRPPALAWAAPDDEAEASEPPTVCLARVGRRLLGRACELGELANQAGLPAPGPSALGRARTVATVFVHLVPSLAERGVHTIEQLIEFQLAREHMMDFSGLAFGAERIASLPARPGVYRMLDRSGQVIYVGKAKNLRSRVSSYFANRDLLDKKVETLLQRLYDIDYEECGSELAALLREAQLIGVFQPPVNRQMAVRPGPPARGVPGNFVVVLPCFGKLELFAVAEGRPLRRQEIDPANVSSPALRSILKKAFRAEARRKELTEAERSEVDVVRRWLARERDRTTLLDMDAAGGLAGAARLLSAYIADALGQQGKTFHV